MPEELNDEEREALRLIRLPEQGKMGFSYYGTRGEQVCRKLERLGLIRAVEHRSVGIYWEPVSRE